MKITSNLIAVLYSMVFNVCLGLKLFMKVTPGVIIGGGRIGSHLFESNGKLDLLLSKRDDLIPSESSGPIYICTRNDDLAAIIDRTPAHRKEDLIFLQNGILTNFLKARGLENNSQALIYYGIAKKGEPPLDGKTDLNPEGLTAVTGKWANDFSERMKQAGLACNIYDRDTFQLAMLEKHIWISAFMAVGAKYQSNVGDVEKNHNSEVRELIRELLAVASKEFGVTFSPGVEDRLCAYARSVAHFPTAIKEFEWRNGWFVDVSNKYLTKGEKDPAPIHTSLLKSVGFPK